MMLLARAPGRQVFSEQVAARLVGQRVKLEDEVGRVARTELRADGREVWADFELGENAPSEVREASGPAQMSMFGLGAEG